MDWYYILSTENCIYQENGNIIIPATTNFAMSDYTSYPSNAMLSSVHNQKSKNNVFFTL